MMAALSAARGDPGRDPGRAGETAQYNADTVRVLGPETFWKKVRRL